MSREAKIRLRRRQVQRNRRIALLCMCVVFSVIVLILFHNFHVQAEKPAANKRYTDICVEKGDTLWDIALEYMSEEYASPAQLIREIQEINQIGTVLHCGQYLVIPYYTEAEC